MNPDLAEEINYLSDLLAKSGFFSEDEILEILKKADFNISDMIVRKKEEIIPEELRFFKGQIEIKGRIIFQRIPRSPAGFRHRRPGPTILLPGASPAARLRPRHISCKAELGRMPPCAAPFLNQRHARAGVSPHATAFVFVIRHATRRLAFAVVHEGFCAAAAPAA